jgi:hypothetical protein
MTMLREVPSGREQAIETLLDMEPQGSFYRASRVLVRDRDHRCLIFFRVGLVHLSIDKNLYKQRVHFIINLCTLFVVSDL